MARGRLGLRRASAGRSGLGRHRPYEDFAGAREDAVWLQDGYVAHSWRAFVADPAGPVRITSPPAQHSGGPLVFIEHGASLTVEVAHDADAAPGALESLHLFDGDEELARTPAAESHSFRVTLPPGARALIVEARYAGGARRVSLPHTVQVVRAGCPESSERYTILCTADE